MVMVVKLFFCFGEWMDEILGPGDLDTRGSSHDGVNCLVWAPAGLERGCL